ncbi:MAG: SDR family oxidoreductase [Bdellovibrionales bacterium]|nr:SDR family oxidoreductase [Bdellovibrionales bacterium]
MSSDSVKTAIVTGASRGIGRHVALRLAQTGFQVALLARNQADLSTLAVEIERTPGALAPLVIATDISDQGQVQRAAETLRKELSSITLLFNNAGANHPGSVNLSSAAFEKVIATNLNGVYYLLHELVPRFKEQRSGFIVNVGSVCSKSAFVGTGAYSASKYGLLGLSEALHRELAADGIKVTTLCPSWVKTEMAAHCPLPPEQMLDPEDIFQAIQYLMSVGPNVAIKELVIDCRFDLL